MSAGNFALPWHEAAWPSFAAQLVAKRHHAWLLHGPQGSGKWELALEIARARLCRARLPNFIACGECASCRALSFDAQNESRFSHPDFVLLMPSALREEKVIPLPLSAQRDDKKSASMDILVEDMREATDALSLSAHHAQGRVCCVYPAEAMNAITANTLLKTLEEPPGETLFIVVTHQRARLLPTVRSRCLSVAAPVPNAAQALEWLQAQGVETKAAQLALGLAGGSPLLALSLSKERELVDHVVGAAESGRWQQLKQLDLKATPMVKVLPLIQRWLCDVERVKAGGAPLAFQAKSALTALAQASQHYSWPRLRDLQGVLTQAIRNARHPANASLMMDALIAELNA
jgi:DNA polymerase III subunit delta'